jgi:hypothetical protein
MNPADQASDEPRAPREPDLAPSEAKRLAARRRFLRGTTAGSGIVIVTLFHRRAAAQERQRRILASSPEACISMTGHQPTGRTVDVHSVSGDVSSAVVRRYVCD